MKNKFLLIALLINTTIAQAEFTRVTDYHLPADNSYSYPNVGRLAASKDANPGMVDAYIRQVDNEIFTTQVFTGIVATMFTTIITGAVANWWQEHKVYCAKKAKEVAQIKAETARIIARG